MEERSKFSGAIAKLSQRPAQQATKTTAAPPSPMEAIRGKGRPPGKRSDPDFQPTTVLLRKQTKKNANRQLEDVGASQDLSDLIEQLLADWIRPKS